MRILAPLLLLACTPAWAQQTAQYTQNVFNMFAINPAVAGSKDCIDVRLGYRQQWVGFPGAPVTGWATVAGTIKSKRRSFHANRHGIGTFVEADHTGPLGYTSFQLAYAYHIQMKQDFYMSLGFFAGLRQEKLSLGDVFADDNSDPALANNGSVFVYPDVTPGIWFYGKSTWAGLSVQQALGNKVKGIGVETRLTRNYIASLGHRFRLNKNFSAVPSGLFKLSPGSPLAMDINVMMEYRRKLGLGVTYRNQDAVAFMIKLPFLKFFTLGYSYDITTSRLRVGGANTHELILGIYPCAALDPSKAIVRCPIFE
ncbi:MAG: type IX secretion system membrane protein PorP/SprF [Flavobacteriales bacterium]|nr:type IX secretion system membrane protein PorP/SprF [Flavobacteriales bacterium]MBK9059943.1 type IX secretion system membrane protein PorP/SprF [Flavobacteriales bacterium]QQS71979.1 MAG: type IX secretion system membrane protein PorP/SprF [Flavobacteriales bacterium]HQV37768.1 type IX secretion system membrane protein PorP/SprF [Flavobacteriales bacterium]HQW30904.1 type IX secretion system membrane protein PorP/SprF [Flavobacteriales bacterium]